MDSPSLSRGLGATLLLGGGRVKVDSPAFLHTLTNHSVHS